PPAPRARGRAGSRAPARASRPRERSAAGGQAPRARGWRGVDASSLRWQEPESAKDGLTARRAEEVDELLPAGALAPGVEADRRVLRDHVVGVRDLNGVDVSGGRGVSRVCD